MFGRFHWSTPAELVLLPPFQSENDTPLVKPNGHIVVTQHGLPVVFPLGWDIRLLVFDRSVEEWVGKYHGIFDFLEKKRVFL